MADSPVLSIQGLARPSDNYQFCVCYGTEFQDFYRYARPGNAILNSRGRGVRTLPCHIGHWQEPLSGVGLKDKPK